METCCKVRLGWAHYTFD